MSIVFHPLFMVTYGVLLALMFTFIAIYPMPMKLLILGVTFLSTAFVPGLFIFLLVKNGAASDLALSNRKDRMIPYLIFITSLLTCVFFFHRMLLPFWLLSLLIGTGVSLLLALLINLVWKISAHGIGIGGLLGAVMGISEINQINPYWLFIIVILVAGMLGTSRLFLKRHTPMQVYAGFGLGFICTFVAAYMSYFFLFI